MAGRFDVADVVEVLQHWQARHSLRHLARSVGMGRDRLRRIVARAEADGIVPGGTPLSRSEWEARVAALFPDRGRRTVPMGEQERAVGRLHELVVAGHLPYEFGAVPHNTSSGGQALRGRVVCRDFLAGLRWPVAVTCVFCGSEKVGHIATRSLWRRKDCRKQFSVKKGRSSRTRQSAIQVAPCNLAVFGRQEGPQLAPTRSRPGDHPNVRMVHEPPHPPHHGDGILRRPRCRERSR